MSLLSDMRIRLRRAVGTLYGFDPNQAVGSISYNAAHAKKLLTNMAFIYHVRPAPIVLPFGAY
jgi:hypothetical protein